MHQPKARHKAADNQFKLCRLMATESKCFSKKLGCLSPACPEVLTFESHCLAKFRPIFDCFIQNVKMKMIMRFLKIKKQVVQIQSFPSHVKSNRETFWGTPRIICKDRYV